MMQLIEEHDEILDIVRLPREDLRKTSACVCMLKYSQVLIVNAQAMPLCLDSTSAFVSQRAVKGEISLRCFQRGLIMPFNERDTSSLPAAASNVCILMSINYTLNELSNSAVQLMCVPSLEE